MAIRKICNKSGCPALIDVGQRYCDKHKQQEQLDKRERNKYYDTYQRDQRSKDFYNSKEWVSLKTVALIRDNYLCVDCLEFDKCFTPADVVDHMKPIKLFWELRLVLSNLRSLCHSHHNQKTAEDKRKIWRNL
ncbi:HNH endonuclease signature motif containing protein [Brevibacillus centrosporus]|uniref:HNH endonuclease n=1 Tax=Brevibacillus centrosporus TaxID=54910 RepID=UPI002E1C5CAE|nr:HNH endonuclease signature motif containing protein [Brevibacillus centrosporus]